MRFNYGEEIDELNFCQQLISLAFLSPLMKLNHYGKPPVIERYGVVKTISLLRQ